jgi:hypothetical protein
MALDPLARVEVGSHCPTDVTASRTVADSYEVCVRHSASLTALETFNERVALVSVIESKHKNLFVPLRAHFQTS